MGRSAPSCLKIITCATHSSVDTDPLQPSQTKSSNVKRGWSFRKQSPKHRVVNNTGTSEISSSLNNKELQESANVNNFKANKSENSSTSEVQCKDEIPPLPIPVSSKLSDLIAATEDHNKYDVTDNKLDLPVDKLDSAGNKDDLPGDKLELPGDKLDKPDDNLDIPYDKFDIPEDKFDMPEDKLNIPEDKFDIPDNKLDIPFEKLDIPDENRPDIVVNNEKKESDAIVIQAAARGFLVRRWTVKHKNAVKLQAAVRGHLVRTHAVGTLRCLQAIVKMQALVRARQAPSILGKQYDGMKPELNSPTIEKLLSNSFARQLLESTPKKKAVNIKCDPLRSDSAWKWLERWVSVSPARIQHWREPEARAQREEHDKEICAENQLENALEPAVPFQIEKIPATGMQPDAESVVEHNSDSLPSPSDLFCQIEQTFGNGEPELSTVPSNENSNASEQVETEERKLVSFGSRKASNPAFIAAQSKFEELTSSSKSISLSNQESCADKAVSSATHTAIKSTKEDGDMIDNSPPHNSRIQVEDIESDSHHPTEIVSAVQQEQQSNIIDKKIKIEVEGKSTESVLVEDLEIKKKEEEDSYLPTEGGIDKCKSPSPQAASPIVPESHGTPSNQVSPQSKAKKNKKRKSLSSARRSPVKPSHDSSARSSLEKLPKEHSFNNNSKIDDEPKSGSSLPSYMQATKSAKAKVHASSGSPISGADSQEKDSLVKKRFSLPANGRHGSPQILRSKSQVTTTKGTATQQSPQDKKWQR